MENELSWVDKYKPKSIDEIIGNKNSIAKIRNWLDCFKDNTKQTPDFKNALLLSGATGTGKTIISELILKEYNYDIIELNSSSLRTSIELTKKIKQIFEAKSIKTIFKKDAKTSVILDEIDGMENKKEFTSNDLISLFNYEKDKYYLNKKISKKDKKYIINKNPIICTCNSIEKTMKSILPEVIHIHLEKPTDEEIFILLKKLNDAEKIQLSDIVLRLIIPYCQYDYRRLNYVMELVKGYLNSNLKIDKLISFIDKLGNKDIQYELYDSVQLIFNDYTLSFQELLNLFNNESHFIPTIIHENFINFIDKNTNENYEKKLDLCIDYYDNLIDSHIIKTNSFGKWDLQEYTGVLNSISCNYILKKTKLKSTLKFKYFDKSALVSKYNYRYYNLKYINQISKKLNLDIENFKILSTLVAYSLFIDKVNLDYTIQKLKHEGVSSKEFQKIIKLSFLYEKYSRIFTKKIQNSIDSKFNNV